MRRLFTFLAAALWLAACAKGATTAGPAKLKAGDYHPLAVGNQWTYVEKGQSAEHTVTMKAIKDGFFVDDQNGLLKMDAEGLRDDKRYLLKEPVERGKSWSSIVSVSSTERYEIVDVGFTTSTPAGTFNDCVMVRATNRMDQNRTFRIEWTFAPNVGIVRIATTAIAGTKEIPQAVLELKSFKIAAP